MRQRKTDYGTIILHWLFVAAFAVALVSGLRIAAETPERTWINLLDVVLPRARRMDLHMQAAVVLVAVDARATSPTWSAPASCAVSSWIKVRLRGLFGRGQARLGALYRADVLDFLRNDGDAAWSAEACSISACTPVTTWRCCTGYGTWVILAFVVLHVLTQSQSGGLSQLLRIFRPAPLPAPPPRLDAIELLGLLAEQSARASDSPKVSSEPLPEAPSQPLQPRA